MAVWLHIRNARGVGATVVPVEDAHFTITIEIASWTLTLALTMVVTVK
jgi:hypothetical protein